MVEIKVQKQQSSASVLVHANKATIAATNSKDPPSDTDNGISILSPVYLL